MFSTKNSLIEIFRTIEPDDHLEKVTFLEQNSKHIAAMEVSEKTFFQFHYCLALFELGRYPEIMELIDPIIEYTFLNNISYGSDKDFHQLLRIKSISQFNLGRLQEAKSIAEQLVGMDTMEIEYQSLLEKIYRTQSMHMTKYRTIPLGLILFAAAASAGLAWLNRTGNSASMVVFGLLVILPCLVALFFIIVNSILAHIKSSRRVEALVRSKQGTN